MERAALQRLQRERLAATLSRAANAPFYRRLLGDLEGIDGTLDISRLPFTTKAELRDAFPYGFLAVPLTDIVRLHSSSGTTGNPTVIYHTQQDIAAWQDLVARCMYMAGMRSSDVFQNIMGYGLFTGGLGFHYGAEKLGAMTIPVGPGNSKRQIWFMQQFKTTAMHILPSYALRLATHVKEMGLDPRRDLSIRMAFVGAEPHTEETRARSKRRGTSARTTPMASPRCAAREWLSSVPSSPACTSGKTAFSWRSWTRTRCGGPRRGMRGARAHDAGPDRNAPPPLPHARPDEDPPGACPCGRTHRRIDRIRGRSDDMLIINGVNIFPMQVEQTLMRLPGIGSNYLIEIHEENYMDKLHVSVELAADSFQGTLSQLEGLQGQVLSALKEEMGVTPVVKLLEAGSLPASEGKAVRVVDRRGQSGKGC